MNFKGKDFFFLGLMSVLILTFSSSCRTFYQVEKESHGNRDTVVSLLTDTGKYVILHFRNTEKHYRLVEVSADGLSLTGRTDTISRFHKSYKSTEGVHANNYRKTKSSPLNEVHVFVSQNYLDSDSVLTIKISEIKAIESFVADVNREEQSRAGAVMIPIFIVVSVAMLAIIASQSIGM
jgi:hypothetical protein